MRLVLDLLVPGIIAGVSCYGMAKKVDVYEALLQGGGQGAGDPPADPAGPGDAADRGGHARASGALDLAAQALGPVLEKVGIPRRRWASWWCGPSAGAALGVGSGLSPPMARTRRWGRTAAVMLGSTETTFLYHRRLLRRGGDQADPLRRPRRPVRGSGGILFSPASRCGCSSGEWKPGGGLWYNGRQAGAEAVASALRREILFQFLVELSDAAAPGQVLDGPNPRENRQVNQEVPQDAPQAVLHPVGQVGDGGAWPGSRSGKYTPSA